MNNNARLIPCLAVFVGFASLPCFAKPAEHPGAKPLTNAQMDTITAGTFAVADGTAAAQGNSVKTQVSTTAIGGPVVQSAAIGHVSAISASSGNPAATATATLSLSVVVP